MAGEQVMSQACDSLWLFKQLGTAEVAKRAELKAADRIIPRLYFRATMI
jgi:hypothetical protein